MSDHVSDIEQPYDEAEFLSRIDGDRELSDEISQLFLDTCPKFLADMQDSLEEGNFHNLSRLAHGVKGSVGVFGAKACSAAAAALETASRDSDAAGSREAWSRLRHEMQRLTTALDERVAGAAPCEF